MKVDVRTTSVGTLEERLHAFEAEYGVPSSDMVKAFTVDGVFHETSDFRRWDFLYGSWLSARKAIAARRA